MQNQPLPGPGAPGHKPPVGTPARPGASRPRPDAGASSGIFRPGPARTTPVTQRPTTPVPGPGTPAPAGPPLVLGTSKASPVPSAPIPPRAQPDLDPRDPRFRRFDLPVSTTSELPGFTITGTVGVVLGVVTRPRDLAHHPDMAFVNVAARQDAVAAMVAQAIEAGADGVIGLAFDGGKVSDNVSEVTAYGTAVLLRR